ncbi:unnamed protein product, partial [Ilex paraguariensis]
MGKEMGFIHNWAEVGPAPLISRLKPSNAPKLDTIAEEGSESFDFVHKKVLFLLPVFLSFMSYLVINRYAIV